MDLGLSDKISLVCASSKGLGRAVAEALAQEGARVAICARSAEPLRVAGEEIRKNSGAQVLPIVADLTRETDIDRLVGEVESTWGLVEVLVTNAGGPPSGPFEKHSLEDWERAVQLNFMSAVRLCRRVIPGMKERRRGRIINITSITVKQPVDGLILSNAVRAAVVGLARSLANELGPYGILVNNVCPGYTKTDRVVRLAEASAREGRSVKQVYQAWEDQIPLGRLAEPEEFAALVTFLASARASYITGTTIPVDGGYIRSLL
ncbi:MAG TPA: SDR family oxidoreductase [Acidobacteriota bacterium]|nr:SDR family oxidoreductase [Acidobacteriota bacterium]